MKNGSTNRGPVIGAAVAAGFLMLVLGVAGGRCDCHANILGRIAAIAAADRCLGRPGSTDG